MGNEVSNLSPEKLHKKLVDNTEGTRYVMDRLLRYLLKEIGEQDLLKITSIRSLLLAIINVLIEFFKNFHNKISFTTT